MAPEWAASDRLRDGSDEQIAYLDPADLETVERFDRWLFVWAPGNTAERAGIAGERDAALARARIGRGCERHDEREAAGELRWVGAAYPTALGAQTARMGTQAWEQLRLLRAAARRARSGGRLARARRAPRAADRAALRRQRAARRVRRHRPARERRGPRLGVVRGQGEPPRRRGLLLLRRWAGWRARSCSTSPRCRTAASAATCACASRRGVVVDASASLGEDVLLARLDTDEGARRAGEFAIGTNEMISARSATRSSTRRSAARATSRSARSFPLLGGENVSAIHWDLICDLRDGGRIDADGEPLLVDGKLVV